MCRSRWIAGYGKASYNKSYMNQLLKILLGVSFAIGFTIGFFTKRYVFLFLSVLSGAGIAALSVGLYLSHAPQDVGLGIIALFPALVILLGALNIGVAVIGGVIGTAVGKRVARKKVMTRV